MQSELQNAYYIAIEGGNSTLSYLEGHAAIPECSLRVWADTLK